MTRRVYATRYDDESDEEKFGDPRVKEQKKVNENKTAMAAHTRREREGERGCNTSLSAASDSHALPLPSLLTLPLRMLRTFSLF